MLARIVNKNINDENFKCGDIVEIISDKYKILGKTIKEYLKVKNNEIVIKKITEDTDSLIIGKCAKSDVIILLKGSETNK